MLEEGFLPLAEAGLPSNQVVVTITPWATGARGEDGKWRSGARDGSDYDRLCSQQLCALRAGNLPLGASSEVLRKGVQFAACQMAKAQVKTKEGEGLQRAVAACARKAGLGWDGPSGLEACAEEGAGLRLQHGQAVASKMDWLYKQPHWSNPPYLFLNGRPLRCPSPTYCTSFLTDSGDEPLKVNGSLLDVACSLLDPAPSACLHRRQREHTTTKTETVTKFCETCWEVGSFQWRHTPGGAAPLQPWLLGAAVALVFAGLLAGVTLSKCSRSRGRRAGGMWVHPSDAQQFLPAE